MALKPTVIVIKVPGVQGPPGTGGGTGGGTYWRSGSGAPTTGLGVVGDWYINTNNGDTYEKTASTVWTKRGETKASQSSVDTLASNIALLAPKANPSFTGTVSGISKAMVGLGNVDNTADSAKPVSTAQATAIASARDRSTHTGTQATTTIANFVEEVQDIVGAMVVAGSNITVNYDDTNGRLELTAVGGTGGTGSVDPEGVRDTIAAALRNGAGITIVNDDAADTITITSLLRTVAGKAPSAGDISLVVTDIVGLQTALDAKAPLASPTFTGTVSGVSKSMVGLGNVDNTSDTNKPVSSAQQLALDAKANTSHNHAATNITSGTLNLERAPIGSVIVVDYYKGFFGATNAWPSARPTTRTDITVIAKGPGTVDSSQPPLSWMIDGDDWDREV